MPSPAFAPDDALSSSRDWPRPTPTASHTVFFHSFCNFQAHPIFRVCFAFTKTPGVAPFLSKGSFLALEFQGSYVFCFQQLSHSSTFRIL